MQMRKTLWLIFSSCVGLGFLLASCAKVEESRRQTPRLVLEPCSGDIEEHAHLETSDAKCAKFVVWENRKTKTGRKIALQVAIIPALAAKPKPDPIFLLAGGPGQAATELDWLSLKWAKKLHIKRDIVLVDQRGTGSSNPLDCIPDGGTNLERFLEPWSKQTIRKTKEEFRDCVTRYDADVRQYTTDIAMDDLNEVRQALGYDKINIYGGSYGTRAAQVYLRRHGDTVRSLVLELVAPLEMKIIIDATEDGERALNLLFEDCAKEAACREAFPNLKNKLRTVLSELENAPENIQLKHPQTGRVTDVTIGPESIRLILFAALYDTLRSALIPLAIDRAAAGDFSVFAALVDVDLDVEKMISTGMQSSVLCNEDLSSTDHELLDAGPSFGIFSSKEMISLFRRSCALFEGADLPSSYFESVKSDVPALVLSGDLDPITPPRWGTVASKNLSHSRHVVVPGTGHGVSHHPCVAQMIVRFIEDASAAKIETACLKDISRFPIFVQPTGYIAAKKKGPAND